MKESHSSLCHSSPDLFLCSKILNAICKVFITSGFLFLCLSQNSEAFLAVWSHCLWWTPFFNYCSRLRKHFQTSILVLYCKIFVTSAKRGAIFGLVDTQATFFWTINDCCMTFVVLRWDKKKLCIAAEGLYSKVFSHGQFQSL